MTDTEWLAVQQQMPCGITTGYLHLSWTALLRLPIEPLPPPANDEEPDERA